MAKGYWVANVDVKDMETYKKYVAANGEVFAKYGAKFIVRAGAHVVKEGTVNPRVVVIEFKDYATALACYESPEYQALKAIRAPAGTSNLAIVEGYDA